MEDWKEYKLKDICQKITDGSHSSPQAQSEGYPMFSVKDMLEYGFDYSKCKYISLEDFLSLKQNDCVPQKGDILVAKDGSYLKQIFVCKETKEEGILSSIAIFRPNDLVDSFFLCYLLKTPDVFNYISNNCVSGSALPRIVLKDFKEVTLKIPTRRIQEGIVSILKSLDDKIEVNRRINDNLEQQAQALFKSWFVDFEPFKGGEFVESELGMIPKGWRVLKLEDLAIISKMSINPQKCPQKLFKHYSIPSYDDAMTPESQIGEEIKSNKFVVEDRMTLFSKLNPRIKRVWYVDKVDENSICSTEFVPYKAKELLVSSFIFGLINSQGFYEFIMSMVNGATGSHQRFHPEESLNYSIAYKEEYGIKYCEVVAPILNQIINNRDESRRLAELRDTLLPRLMSGELEVNEVENKI